MNETTLHIQLSLEEAVQLLWLLNRAVNSLQPEKWPMITDHFLEALEDFVKRGGSK